MGKISIARSAAHAILLAIEAGMGHSDDLLRDDALMESMPGADRRLTTAMVLGVLRWQIPLDAAIRGFISKPKAKLDPAVLAALRLGAFQLLYLDRVPVHAAINESVELVKQSGYRSAAGLVNAVLRKVAGASQPSVAGGSAVMASHPGWMVERWTAIYGAATACAICTHNQGQPDMAVRLAGPEVEQELTAAGLSMAPGRLLSAVRMVVSGDVTGTAAFREGRARVQDEGSQLVGEIAAAVTEKQQQILDCCAAPGGKTLILAERNPAARVVACEASKARLGQLRARLAALGDRVECMLADATALGMDSEFDAALADVPCSGTGTLGRNPEIRHRLQPGDLARQAERQNAILASALRAVRPGGRVVYSTCSLEPEENEQVVGGVAEGAGGARIVPLGPLLEALRKREVLTEDGAERIQNCVTGEGFLRLIPGAFGTDGFFVAVVERLL